MAFPVGCDRTLLVAQGAFCSVFVPSGVANFVLSCREALDAGQIADQLAKRIGAPLAVAQAVVDDWIERGILISKSQLHEALVAALSAGDAEEKHQTASVSTVAIVTRDRPDVLGRAVRSYGDRLHHRAGFLRFLVVDDSVDPGPRGGTTAETLLTCAEKVGIRVELLGRSEKQRMSALIAEQAGVARETVSFALFGEVGRVETRTGANRNTVLLATMGEQVLSVDDDTIARVARPPNLLPGLRVCSHVTPWDGWFFPTRADALAAAPETDIGLLEGHESLTGRRVAKCVEDAATLGELDVDLAPSVLSELSGEAYVAVTVNGMLGDSGVETPLWFALDGPSLRRLVASEEAYRTSFRSREVLRCATRSTIALSAAGMATAFSFDNRSELPPFLPVGRNEDGFFMSLLRRVCPDGCIGHVPTVLLHDPPNERSYLRRAEPARSHQRRLSTLVALACAAYRPADWPRDPAMRMRSLGAHLVELASMRRSDFEYVVWTEAIREGSIVVATLEERLHRMPSPPGFWVQDVMSYISVLRSTLSDRSCLLACDLPVSHREDGLAFVQRLVRCYGELLGNWTEIREAAMQLHLAGESFARPLSSLS